MTERAAANLGASIRQRLLNIAKQRDDELQTVLVRHGTERLLYRLSRSDAKDRFVLKGAARFYVWEGELRRPTRDIDFLGYGDASAGVLSNAFRGVCTVDVAADGLAFPVEGVRAEPIRDTQQYGGIRVRLVAMLAGARIPLSVDVGFGDAATPRVETAYFPTLLDLPAPRIRVYPPETMIAEKYEAMVSLGIVNTRMKDFYDVWILSEFHAFDGATLSMATAATFARRKAPIPSEPPVALTPLFGSDPAKQAQWRAFLNRSRLTDAPADLSVVIDRIRRFLWPLSESAREPGSFRQTWLPGIGWSGA